MYQQLWGYKVEEKLYLGVCEQKRLNTTALGHLNEESIMKIGRNVLLLLLIIILWRFGPFSGHGLPNLLPPLLLSLPAAFQFRIRSR
jgi:hypothetical protein